MFREKLALGVAAADGGAVDAAVGAPDVMSDIVVAALPAAMPSSSEARAASYWMASSVQGT